MLNWSVSNESKTSISILQSGTACKRYMFNHLLISVTKLRERHYWQWKIEPAKSHFHTDDPFLTENMLVVSNQILRRYRRVKMRGCMPWFWFLGLLPSQPWGLSMVVWHFKSWPWSQLLCSPYLQHSLIGGLPFCIVSYLKLEL